MIIFPAIDVLNSKPTMLYQGDYDKVDVVGESVIELAREFEKAGASWLHMVDLDGAKAGGAVNTHEIKPVLEETGLQVQLGGGIRNMETLDAYFNLGLNRAIIGSAAILGPDFLKSALEKYGDRIAVGLDALDGELKIQGWTEGSGKSLVEGLKYIEDLGVKTTIITDISRDGAMEGTALDLYEELEKSVTLDIIASGGVSTIEDVKALKEIGVYGCIIGKALYNGSIDLRKALEVGRG